MIKDEKLIKELLIIVDMNNGFTREGLFKNPFMEAMIPCVNDLAIKFHNAYDKCIILINEGHHPHSQEFKTFSGPNGELHCLKGSSEVVIVDELRWIELNYEIFTKNTTMGIFAPGFLAYLDSLINLEKVVLAGGVTDICLMEMAIPTKKYFDQNDRDIEVNVPVNVVDTYDAPWHNRDEYNMMAFKLMIQAGIKVTKKYNEDEYLI